MQIISDESLFANALMSERNYFALGASERSGPGWTLSFVSGFEFLAAAGVCILETQKLNSTAVGDTIAQIESDFVAACAHYARFYSDGTDPALQALMEGKGYRRRTEIVHAFTPLPDAQSPSDAARWHLVGSEGDWAEKAVIHTLPSFASDGYEATPEAWVAFERRKAETGEMTFWVFLHNDLPVATTGLIRLAHGIVRIKNFYVRVDQRGKGIGTMALRHLLQDLRTMGRSAAVVLSVEDSIGGRLYLSSGGREVGRIYEWSRVL